MYVRSHERLVRSVNNFSINLIRNRGNDFGYFFCFLSLFITNIYYPSDPWVEVNDCSSIQMFLFLFYVQFSFYFALSHKTRALQPPRRTSFKCQIRLWTTLRYTGKVKTAAMSDARHQKSMKGKCHDKQANFRLYFIF